MTTTPATSTGTTRTRAHVIGGTNALAWAVLAAAVLEVAAPIITIAGPGASPGSGVGADLLITPVGWAFSIWGVIYTLAIAQAVAVLVKGPGSVPRRLQVDQVVLYVGGAVWILMSALGSSYATAAALLVMLVAAVDGVLTTARHSTARTSTTPTSAAPTWLVVLTRASVGLYAGWVTAAFFLNVATALVETGAVAADTLTWQLVVLVVAALSLIAVTVATRGIPAYAAAGAWALVGIAITGAADGTAAVLTLAVLAAVVLVAVAVAVRTRAAQTATAGLTGS